MAAICVTPGLVKSLGDAAYGSWILIGQITAYAGLFDLADSSAIKFRLAARNRNERDDTALQISEVVSALFLSLPLFISVCAVILAFTLSSVHAAPGSGLAASGVVASLAVQRFSNLLNNVLYGENKAYQGTLLMASLGVLVACGDLLIAQIAAPFWWLGITRFASATIAAFGLWAIVKRNRPDLVLSYTGVSGALNACRANSWYLLSRSGSLLVESSDIVLISFACSPATATLYALTGALPKLCFSISGALTGAFNAGLGQLFGAGDIAKLRELRSKVSLLPLWSVALFGGPVIIVNQEFVKRWAGEQYYLGDSLVLAIVFNSLLLLVSRYQNNFLNACLQVNDVTKVHLATGCVGAVCALALAAKIGAVGVPCGLAIGRATAILACSYLATRKRLYETTAVTSELVGIVKTSGFLLVCVAVGQLSQSTFATGLLALVVPFVWTGIFSSYHERQNIWNLVRTSAGVVK